MHFAIPVVITIIKSNIFHSTFLCLFYSFLPLLVHLSLYILFVFQALCYPVLSLTLFCNICYHIIIIVAVVVYDVLYCIVLRVSWGRNLNVSFIYKSFTNARVWVSECVIASMYSSVLHTQCIWKKIKSLQSLTN